MQTIELNGRSIAVMGGSCEQAEEFIESEGFRADLMSFVDGDGRPVWDGRGVFAPSVRPALPDEVTAFRQSFENAIIAGDADGDDPADWLMFLVDVREASEGGTS